VSDDALHQIEQILTLAMQDAQLTTDEKIELLISQTRKLLQSMAAERKRAEQAEFKATILQAQLGGWEAACAAQVAVLGDVLSYLHGARYNVETLKERIEEATETNAGELLLRKLAAMQAWIRKAGHQDDCALQYGGSCSCGKSDLLRGANNENR
jgi:hypothetical protein